MADESHVAAENAVADMLFGPEETVVEEDPIEEVAEEVELVEGDDEAEEEYEPDPKPVVEGDDPEALIEFEWDGQIIEAPLSIKEALMRTEDYTTKTQDVAAQRKELEIQSENLKRVNSQYDFAVQVQGDAVKVSQLEQQIEQARVYMRENIDGMSHTDLEKLRIAIDDTRQERDTLMTALQRKSNEFQQAHEQTLKGLMDKSTEVLRQKVPGWNDETEGQLKAYALDQGIPEQTYNAVVDPLEKLILHKAMKYDALQSGVKPAVTLVKNTRTIKPKSRNPMPQDKQDQLNLRKKIKNPNKSAKAKADLIGMDIANRFKL